MKANGIKVALRQFDGWVLEDETKLYFFNCSDCALAWIVENKPDLIEDQEEAANWHESRRWCSHAEARPILAIDKSLLDIAESIDSIFVTLKGRVDETP